MSCELKKAFKKTTTYTYTPDSIDTTTLDNTDTSTTNNTDVLSLDGREEVGKKERRSRKKRRYPPGNPLGIQSLANMGPPSLDPW